MDNIFGYMCGDYEMAESEWGHTVESREFEEHENQGYFVESRDFEEHENQGYSVESRESEEHENQGYSVESREIEGHENQDVLSPVESREIEGHENQDVLSELPLSLILHILSFLPMKDVVSTTILSKRWKNLWTTVPCLNFRGYVEGHGGDEDRIRDFVNRTLMFWKGTKIQTFTVNFTGRFDAHIYKSLSRDLDLWVLFAKDYNVEELKIHLGYTLDGSNQEIYCAPQCLNSCSSIKSLSLSGCNLRIPEPPVWNQLKSLIIDGFCISEHLINQIFSGAPQLEVFELSILESGDNLNIWSRSFKKMKIEKYLYFGYDKPPTDTKLRIWGPNLERLQVSGVLYCEWLLKNVSSLTDVTLDFCGSQYYDNAMLPGKELLEETLRQIISTIRHVEKVTLSDSCVQAIVPMWKKYSLSPLSKVKFLKLSVRSIKLDKMVGILSIFPKLKTLIIENKGCPGVMEYRDEHIIRSHELDAEYTRDLPKLSTMLYLRTVEITSCLCETSVFPFVELLLKKARGLKKMVIQAEGIMLFPPDSFFLASEKLLSMRRSSPNAKVFLCRL